MIKILKNQVEGPCEDHVLVIIGAIFWPFVGDGATGYTQQCEIWNGTSLRILFNPFSDGVKGHFQVTGGGLIGPPLNGGP